MTTTLGKQEQMFANADREGHTCYIARWLASGKFAYESHASVDAWVDKYGAIEEERRMYGEIHREGRPVCEYYDIDTNPAGLSLADFIEGFVDVRNEFCETIGIKKIRKQQLIVLNASDDEKFSVHILVRNKQHFDTIADHKRFAQQFAGFLATRSLDIDVSVYNKNSVFRCPGSHKPNSTRTFTPERVPLGSCDDMRFAFCSTIEDASVAHTIAVPAERVREVVPHNHTDNELLEMFWKLSPERWDTYEGWRNLLWLGHKEGIARDDLCELSAQSHKHVDASVDVVLDSYRADACDITLGTLKFYLREDLPADEYATLFPVQKKNRLTAQTLKLGHRDVAEVCSRKMPRLKYCNETWYLCREHTNLWSVVKKPHTYVVVVIQDEINELIADCCRLMKGADDGRRKELEDERKELFKCYALVAGTGYAPCVMNYLTTYLFHDNFASCIDNNVGFLSFKNGILNLKTGGFRDGLEPEDYVSFTLGFDYAVVRGKSRQFVWDAFKKVLNNDDDHLDYFLSLVGHAFTGESALVKHMYFMIDGSGDGRGDNGKTFLFNIFNAIMGGYVAKPKSALLDKHNTKTHKQIAGLKGKRFIYMEEFPQKAINDDLLKELADGGEMDNEVMFGTTETINLVGMFFALSNHTPQLDADSSAGYNRYKEVAFKSHFDRTGSRTVEDASALEYIADATLGAKIVSEHRDAVVGLVVEYAMRFYTSGIPATPDDFKKAELATKQTNDGFAEWFDGECEAGDEDETLAEKRIAEASGMDAKRVRKGMTRMGYKYHKDLSGGRGYKGGYIGVRFVVDNPNE